MSHSHKHDHQHFLPNSQNFLVKLAAYASISAAGIIIIMKLIAWFLTGSVTMLAALADSLLDIGSSLINLIAIKYAMQPPDNEHRFGHNKAEDLAVFTQSAFFGVSGLFLIVTSIKRFFFPEFIRNSEVGIIIIISSIIVTIILVVFQRYIISKTNSSIVEADHQHYFVDLLSNIAVLASFLISQYFNISYADPIFALLIASYVMYSAWKLLRQAFNNLMDHEFNREDKEKIQKIIDDNVKVKGLHDLKTRQAGNKRFIQFHLQFDNSISLLDAHNISHEIEKNILEIFPSSDIIIHQDPDNIDEKIEYLSVH